jgi:hypothetical protein
MRARNTIIVAAIAAGATMLPGRAALAQGSTTSVPVSASTAPGQGVAAGVAGQLAQPEHVFTAPAVIGLAWTQALQAALDGVKHLLGGEQLEAQQATAASVLRPTARPDGADKAAVRATPPAPRPSIPAWRAAWMPASALREAIRTSPVQVGPVAIAPPTESAHDAHGESAVLPGGSVSLPWLVP